jgi:predicted Rossmann fold nucleotide-binding protein DprA/Smf involved in DNA uptake
VTDFLDEKREEIDDRLAALKPAVEEYDRLQDAASALAKVSGSAPATTTATSAAKAATAAPTAKRRARRRNRTGGRARQALKLIGADPGIAIPSLAEKMGVKASYLYRILPPLEQAGRIEKQGRGWHLKQA